MPKTRKMLLPVANPAKGQKRTAKSPASEKKPAIQVKNHSKQGIILNLLQRQQGATVAEMAEAIDWQKHSVLGMLSGVLKKKLGLTIASVREEKRGRVYRTAGGKGSNAQ